jgi:acetyl esterase/lipase
MIDNRTYFSSIVALILTVLVLLAGCQQEDQSSYLQKSYTYSTVNDCELQADVFRLPDEQVRPAIIWLHPGGLVTGSRDWLSTDQLNQYVQAGYVVVAIDYRLAPETKLSDIVSDVEEAYSWVRAEGLDLFQVDPDRIALVGHSAGAFLALTVGSRLQPPPKALVSFYGYGDISGPWATEPSAYYNERTAISKARAFEALGNPASWCNPTGKVLDDRFQFYVYGRQHGIWPREVTGYDPKNEQIVYDAYEPVNNVSAAYPPTMLLHGKSDKDVPYEQSLQMVEKLERQNVLHEFISAPTWGHMFDSEGFEDPAVQDALNKALAFLEQHLKQ